MKKLVLPEKFDSRIVQASKILKREIDCILLDDLDKGMKLVASGDADCLLSGAHYTTRETLRSAFKHVGLEDGINKASSGFLIELNEKKFYFADCAVQIDPNVDELLEIVKLSCDSFEKITEMKSNIALLSYSTLGSADGQSALKMREVAKRLGLIGELQGDAALVPSVFEKKTGKVLLEPYNVFIFPNLDAGNICYKFVERLAGAKAIGPILHGFKKPIGDLSRGCSINDIVELARIIVKFV